MAASLLVSPTAHAGSYVGAFIDPVSKAPSQYSGGTQYIATGVDAWNQATFGDKPDSASQQSYGGGSSPTRPNGTHADCSGAISTSWKWVPAQNMDMTTDPPPTQVIIMQTCTASVTVEQPGGTGSYATGLGQSGSVSFDPPAHLMGSATDTVYQVMPGGATVPLKDLNAKATVTNSPANASVSYTAAIYPVTISLTGGIGLSTAKYLLVGQQLGATLNAGPLTQTSWNWSVSGGSPFKNWAGSDSTAIYTPLGSETGSQLTCNFAQPSTMASVSCTAHLAVPSGSSPSSGLDVTATQSLTVEKPSAQLDVYIGTVTDLPSSTNPNTVALQQIYTYPSTGQASGLSWFGTITTPASYVNSGQYGRWNWTQLLKAQRQMKDNGVYWQFAVNTTMPATIINGVSVLDGNYPYGNFWYSSDGTRTGNADSPDQGLDSYSAIREFDVSDSFDDYLMYQPPGSGSLPVPLKETDWFWDFQATKDASNNWSTSGKNAQWGTVGDFPAFPEWTFCATPGHLVYVAP